VKLRFRVTGSTSAEVMTEAHRVASGFFGTDDYSLDVDVGEIPTRTGTGHVAFRHFEADVVATARSWVETT
jgi:hypothetical protein